MCVIGRPPAPDQVPRIGVRGRLQPSPSRGEGTKERHFTEGNLKPTISPGINALTFCWRLGTGLLSVADHEVSSAHQDARSKHVRTDIPPPRGSVSVLVPASTPQCLPPARGELVKRPFVFPVAVRPQRRHRGLHAGDERVPRNTPAQPCRSRFQRQRGKKTCKTNRRRSRRSSMHFVPDGQRRQFARTPFLAGRPLRQPPRTNSSPTRKEGLCSVHPSAVSLAGFFF